MHKQLDLPDCAFMICNHAKFDTFVSGYHSIGEYDGNGKTVFVAAKKYTEQLATDPFQFVQIQNQR